jgi:hypothetical protein
MGVGTREMGYLFGQYRRLAGHFQVLKTPVTSFFLKYTIYSFFLCCFPHLLEIQRASSTYQKKKKKKQQQRASSN